MLKGTITIPSDKSISQRALILSTLAQGSFEIKNFCLSQDCLSTLGVVKNLGIDTEFVSETHIKLKNNGLLAPQNILNCNNSGTCMRMMSGVLAGQNFNSILIGDESLSKRPMKRIIDPLILMGAKCKSNNGYAPLKFYGQNLYGIKYLSPVSSAQVKSAVLLAGVQAEDVTVFSEPFKSRNHTEIMLKNMGADIYVNKNEIKIKKSVLSPKNISVVGDFSSAAFFIAAGLVIPNSEIIIKNVGLNPTRTGFLSILKNMNANIEILDYNENNGEPYGDLKVNYSNLTGITIEGEVIPNAIDELPLFALLGACANGKTVLKDASELRKKESDRISAIVNEIQKLGIVIEETPDGFIVEGKQSFTGGIEVSSHKDHRIAMCLYIAGLLCKEPISIKDFDCINISFPEFINLIEQISV
ncbi:3-phosphoshikimate 1-carboxyvinyltransferase [bacterium]|nr:3-phosphoshikimate 1-carboxyvinyltransferase [bacterium]